MLASELTTIKELTNPNIKVTGYLRVSTEKQRIDRQRKIMKDVYGLTEEQLIIEKKSGKDINEKLKKIINDGNAGDIVIISSLDRLGRDYIHNNDIISAIIKKQMILIVHKEKTRVDENTPPMELLFLGFASAKAHEERLDINERVNGGIASRRAKAIPYNKHQANHREKLANKEFREDIKHKTREYCCEKYQLKRSTYFKYKKIINDPKSAEKRRAERRAKIREDRQATYENKLRTRK